MDNEMSVIDIEENIEEGIESKMVIGDKKVGLAYSIARVERIEAATGKPVAVMFQTGALQISEIKVLVGMALKYEEGGFVSPKQGMEFAETLLRETSYNAVSSMISEALQRDCPFFFKVD